MQYLNNDRVLKDCVSNQPYHNLLITIATNFGFNKKQSENFAQEIYANASRYHSSFKTRHLSLRVCLCKMMVSKCIFKIGQNLCSQDNNLLSTTLSGAKYFNSICTCPLKLQEMKLSYRSVFILNNILGFTEGEIAELLNITSVKVKERISKANSFLNNSQAKLIA
jgi:hypothetical protein